MKMTFLSTHTLFGPIPLRALRRHPSSSLAAAETHFTSRQGPRSPQGWQEPGS